MSTLARFLDWLVGAPADLILGHDDDDPDDGEADR